MDNGTHIIDHFLLNNGLFDHMLEYYSMHDGSNLSFHSPLVLTLNLYINYCASSSRRHRSRPKGQEASVRTARFQEKIIKLSQYHGILYNAVIKIVLAG